MKMYIIIFDSDYLHTLSKWKDYISGKICADKMTEFIQNDFL